MPITCPHCSRSFPGDKLNARHVSLCLPSVPPDPCLCGHVSTSGTQMKRHKQGCDVWKARDAKAVRAERKRATNIARYGVEDATQTPEARARRAATNVARYGADNPFAKGASTFQKVQDAIDGKRPVLKGADNPFAKPDVQEKVRAAMVEKYGAANPQQVGEIRARTRDTMHARYGGELLGSPVLREQINTTNLTRYGTTEPSRTPEVTGRIRQTNLARYGVEWTNQDPDVRRRQLETMFAHYDGKHYFASEEGKREVRAALTERYGVEFPGAIDGHWEKAVAAFRERYGVDHPLQLGEFLDKRVQTNREVYGADSPLQNPEVKARMISTKMRKYGNPWGPPPQNGPNGLERLVHTYAPTLVYTGDFTYWRWLPKLSKHKNPDFILPGPDAAKPKKGVTRVVEVFGDFWHSRMFTGKAPFDHEQELIDAYADIGIACLVLWESEVKTQPDDVRERLAAHLA